jgi:hypothetical protein
LYPNLAADSGSSISANPSAAARLMKMMGCSARTN